jgi:hypothetical protein
MRRIFVPSTLTQVAERGSEVGWSAPMLSPGRVYIDTPSDTKAIMVDPHYTSPGMLLAVSQDGSIGAQFVRPGEVASFSRPSNRYFVWNALGGLAAALRAGPSNFSRVAFLAASGPEHFLDLVRSGPRGSVRTLRAGARIIAPSALPGGTIPDAAPMLTVGVQKVRIRATATPNLSGVPCDFTATLRLYSLAGVQTSAAAWMPYGMFGSWFDADGPTGYDGSGSAFDWQYQPHGAETVISLDSEHSVAECDIGAGLVAWN